MNNDTYPRQLNLFLDNQIEDLGDKNGLEDNENKNEAKIVSLENYMEHKRIQEHIEWVVNNTKCY